MPIYERKDLLRKLQSTLLQTRDERKDPAGNAFLRTENDPVSPGACSMASGMQCEGEESIRECKKTDTSSRQKACLAAPVLNGEGWLHMGISVSFLGELQK